VYKCQAPNGNPNKLPIAQAQTYFAEQTHRQELQTKNIEDLKRLDARKKLSVTEKKFSGVVMNRGVDKFGVAEIRATGDKRLFGGNSTQDMKNKYKVKGKKPLADVLPTVSLKAKDLAAEMTMVNTEMKDLQGKTGISNEHLASNTEVRNALMARGIRPENLPPEEDIKKVERRIKAEDKKRLGQAKNDLKTN
jgi:DNA-damage-inducible protein D